MKEETPIKDDFRIDPCFTCQPLGAVYAAIGFYHCLPIVHGSQGCVAYLRSQLIRSFRAQILTATTSLTEDSAVYGGRQSLIEAVKNSVALYSPKMVAVFTTCLSETIGDDVKGIIKGVEKIDGVHVIPVSTASYKGDHFDGYDNALSGILEYFYNKYISYRGEIVKKEDKLTVIPGFVGPADFKELGRITSCFAESIVVGDTSSVLNSPEYVENDNFSEGGTNESEMLEAFEASQVVICQKYNLSAVNNLYDKVIKSDYYVSHLPIGIKLTDKFVYSLSINYNKSVPDFLIKDRKELVSTIRICKQYLFGKKAVIFESPDIAYGLTSLCLELGIQPVIIGSSKKVDGFENDIYELVSEKLEKRPIVLNGVDHFEVEKELEKLIANDIEVEFIFGNSKAKYIENRFKIPLIRVGFPISDRVSVQRRALIGYRAMLQLTEELTNTSIQRNDKYVEGVI